MCSGGTHILRPRKFCFPLFRKVVKIAHSRSLQPLFTKLAKSHISAQFFVGMFVLGWYTYFETAQVLFPLPGKRGRNSENLWMTFIRYFSELVCIFFAYWRTAEKNIAVQPTKDVIIRQQNLMLPNTLVWTQRIVTFRIFFNTSVDNFI